METRLDSPFPDLERLRQPFPAEAIKTRAGGGGSRLSYIEGFTVIRRLNEACPSWDFEILREWIEENGHHKAHVRLSIFGLGRREHIGVHAPTGRPGTEDVDAKAAVTDALKKAATLFGVGLELYGPDYEAGEVNTPRGAELPPRDRTTTQNTVPVQQTASLPPSDLATPRQTKFIQAIVREFGMSDDELADELDNLYNKTLAELDRRDASAFIERLQSRRTVTEIAS